MSYPHLEVVGRFLLNSKHLLLLLLHLSLLLESLSHLFWITDHICKGRFLYIKVERLRFYDSGVLITCFNPPGQGIVFHWGYSFNLNASKLIDSFKFNQYFFKSEERSTSDSTELRAVASCSTYLTWCLDPPCWTTPRGIQRRRMTSSYGSGASWMS